MIVDRIDLLRRRAEGKQVLTGKDLVRSLLIRHEQGGLSGAADVRRYLDSEMIGVVTAVDTDPCSREGIGIAIGWKDVPREAYVVMVVNDSIARKMNDKKIRKLIGEVHRHILNLNLNGYPLGEVTEEIADLVLANVKHDH